MLLSVIKIQFLGEPLGDVSRNNAVHGLTVVDVFLPVQGTILLVAIGGHTEANGVGGAPHSDVVVLGRTGLHHSLVDVVVL